jgi:hypothetical protein
VNVLKLPLASEAVDRSGELRLKPDELARLWKSARILHFASGKFRVKESYELDFQSADQIAQLRKDSSFAEGEELFLGIDNLKNTGRSFITTRDGPSNSFASNC